MRMSAQERIAAPRERVWSALNDPEVLRQAIPGCQSLERESAEKLRASLEVKIGPIGARFNSAITLTDVSVGRSYTLIGEGQAGTVGSAKTTIKVQLMDDGAATLLAYDVDAQVSGRLAQLGGPIIDATAKQFAMKFFKQFGAAVSGDIAPATGNLASSTVRQESVGVRAHPFAWILAIAAAAGVGFLIGRATAPPVVLDKALLQEVLRQQPRTSP